MEGGWGARQRRRLALRIESNGDHVPHPNGGIFRTE